MRKPFDTMSEGEKEAFRYGQELIVNEFLAEIAALEASRNPESSYGKGQLFILRELVSRLCGN